VIPRRVAPLLALAVAACHSPGPYGHAPNYAPLDDETRAFAGTRDYDPVMYMRQPDEWRKTPVALFGVVETRAPGANGKSLLKLTVRRIEPRNLCENEKDEDTCRVTVSDRDFGVVYAAVTLRGEDDIGPKAVGQKSLVHIAGMIGEEPREDGAPVVRATYCRHWPVHTYVTRSAASDMRQ
jgi:hypothetical protein